MFTSLAERLSVSRCSQPIVSETRMTSVALTRPVLQPTTKRGTIAWRVFRLWRLWLESPISTVLGGLQAAAFLGTSYLALLLATAFLRHLLLPFAHEPQRN